MDKQDEAKLKEWFKDNGLRSFSPQTSIMLLEIGSDLSKLLEKEKDQDIKRILGKYADSLITASYIGHIQQGAVIDKLAELVGVKK